jgi:hypothetical protein
MDDGGVNQALTAAENMGAMLLESRRPDARIDFPSAVSQAHAVR